MRAMIFLTKFFAVKRLVSGPALLMSLLCLLLMLTGFLSTVVRIENYARSYAADSGGTAFAIPVQNMDKGSVHMQLWEATNFTYLHSYPIIGGALLPLRFSAPWLFIILPLLGLLLGACEVSSELETGVAQTLYISPVHRPVLGMARILGDSLAASILISVWILIALAIGTQLVSFEISGIHVARSVVFVLFLGFYTSIFVQVGNLISALARRSASSLWICVIVVLCLIGVRFVGENLLNASHDPYSSLPLPRLSVNRILGSPVPMVDPSMTDEEIRTAVGPEFGRYLLELNNHADEVHQTLRTDYQRERWVGLVSPVHAMWEVAQQLLQDRHNFSTELFAPIVAMDPPPSIRQSLAAAWPELVGLLAAWLLLFGLNIRVLSRLEV